MDWIELCRLDSIEIGKAAYADGTGRPLCVVRLDEDHAAVVDDTCPHAGASLSGGGLYNGCIVCPWHAWEFRVSDGRCPDNPAIAVKRYPCRINHEGVVEVGVVGE